MKLCESCGEKVETKTIINGKTKYLAHGRIFCLSCSPFNFKKTSGIQKTKICKICNKEFKTYNREKCFECFPAQKRLTNIELKETSKPLSNLQEQILLGHLLGDGSLQKGKRNTNAYFVVHRATSDIEYLKWTASNFKKYLSREDLYSSNYLDIRTDNIYYTSVLYTRCLPIFTEYRNKWYPEGKKIVPKDLILTPLTIAVWFCDDGSVSYSSSQGYYMKLSTHSFSEENIYFLHNQLTYKYGSRIRIQKANKPEQFTIQISHRQTIKNIINDILNVFPPLKRKKDILETF